MPRYAERGVRGLSFQMRKMRSAAINSIIIVSRFCYIDFAKSSTDPKSWLFVRRFPSFRGREFLEARIIPQRIEHWIEPEQRGSERDVRGNGAFVRCLEQDSVATQTPAPRPPISPPLL